MFSTPALSERERYIEDWFEIPMLIVVSLLVVTLVIPLLFEPSPWWLWALAACNFFIWCAFYVELFVKLYVAEDKLGGLKRNWFLVLIALSPLILPFRLLRLSRLVSAIRLLGLQYYVDQFSEKMRKFIYNIEYILIGLVLFVFVSALVMWQVEVRYDGSVVTMADALWWAVVTITTIGYGDLVPGSHEGRLVGAFVGLIGTILFMVFVARVTALFVHDTDIETLKQLIEENKVTSAADK